MAFAFRSNNSATASGATSVTCNVPTGATAGDLFVAVYGFEAVAAGSGPWIIPNTGQYPTGTIGPASGWSQACWAAPSASGSGIEVWVAIYSTGATFKAEFVTSQNVVVGAGAWTGEYNPTGNISGAQPRVAEVAQVTGDRPPAPSVAANVGELVVACGADSMTASKFGTPSGFTNRVDVVRAAAGTVEATIADAVATVAAPTGPITFPNAAASPTTRGATATLAIVPAPAGASSGALLEASMPPNLDLGPGYTLRVTALATTNGSVVSGVNVSNFAVLVQDTGEATDNLGAGPYLLVPGPGA